MKQLIIIIAGLALYACASTNKSDSSIRNEIFSNKEELNISFENTIDTSKHRNTTVAKIEFMPGRNSTLELIDGNIKIEGEVVTITKYVSNTYENGITNIKRDSVFNIEDVKNLEELTSIKTEPAEDPRKWRYIFYSGLLLCGMLLYLNRFKLFNFLTSLFR